MIVLYVFTGYLMIKLKYNFISYFSLTSLHLALALSHSPLQEIIIIIIIISSSSSASKQSLIIHKDEQVMKALFNFKSHVSDNEFKSVKQIVACVCSFSESVAEFI